MSHAIAGFLYGDAPDWICEGMAECARFSAFRLPLAEKEMKENLRQYLDPLEKMTPEQLALFFISDAYDEWVRIG